MEQAAREPSKDDLQSVSASQPHDGDRAATLPGGPQAGRPQSGPFLLPEGCVGPRPCPILTSLIRALFQGPPQLSSRPGPSLLSHQRQAQLPRGAP